MSPPAANHPIPAVPNPASAAPGRQGAGRQGSEQHGTDPTTTVQSGVAAGRLASGRHSATVEPGRQPGRPPGLISAVLAGTPGRMRLYGTIAAVLCVLSGVLGGVAAASSAGSLGRAQADTEQVVRAQSIAANLLRADAASANAFLVGGSEPASQRATFDTSMAAAAQTIAQAAAAQPADAQALARLNESMQNYSELVEHARADNRQGLTLGQTYQQSASVELRTNALPLAQAVVEANRQRLGSGFGGELGWPRWQAGLAVLGLLVGLVTIGRLSVWLARRTHRRFNVAITIGFVVLAVVGLVGLAAQVVTITRMNSFSAGPLHRTTTSSDARTQVYDAQANESLALIARGSGQAYEANWRSATRDVRAALKSLGASPAALNAYTDSHAKIVDLDTKQGDWNGAVAVAIDTKASGFADLDKQLSALSEQDVARATDALRSRWLLQLLQVLVPISGVVAAWFVVRGVGERVAEYQ